MELSRRELVVAGAVTLGASSLFLRRAADAQGPDEGAVTEAVEILRKGILEADKAPGEWLSYAGNYAGHRHTPLAQVNKSNVRALRLAWASQLRQIVWKHTASAWASAFLDSLRG